MARSSLTLIALLALAGCDPASKPEEASATPAAVPPGTPVTEEEKTLYALGLSMGDSIKVFQLSPEELVLVQSGLTDSVTGQTPKAELETYGPKLTALAMERGTKAAAGEKEKSKELLTKAAAEAGAQTLPSGLIFLDVTAGTGAAPTAADMVKVNYKGTLRDGTVFDSSYERGEPAVFPLGRVIPCWTEGMQKMKVGGKAKLTCPADIAYGDRGSPPVIPGGAALQFEVELLEIVAAPH